MTPKDYILSAQKNYQLQINMKYLQQNLIALEELKAKNNQSYSNLISTAENGKITALGIIKLANKGLIFGKDFNIIPFKNKLTIIIDSSVYQKRIEQAGYNPKRGVIFIGEDFEWDTENQKPLKHKINFNVDTSKYENIIGAYAFAKNLETGQTQGILYRKSDIDRLKNSSPSGNSQYSPWVAWPKEMVLAKLYRSLAKELGIDISDIDLDEKEIKDNGDMEYINFKEINTVENDVNIKELKNLDVPNQYYEDRLVSPYTNNGNVVIEEDISNLNNDNWDME